MSYSANQYNYATPLSSSMELYGELNHGKQLFDSSLMPASVTAYGVTITNLGDGGFTIIGASTGYALLSYQFTLPLGTYAVSAPGNVLGSEFRIRVHSAANVYVDYRIGTTFTLSTVPYRITAIIQTGPNLSYVGAPFYPMLNIGSAAAPWEPFTNGVATPRDDKFFSLANNVLDGSYIPITGDVGLWGSSISSTSGVLTSPYVLTVNESAQINAVRLVGSRYNYPVAFTIQVYNGSNLLHTVTETANANIEYVKALPRLMAVTKLIITITKISASNAPARVYNVFNPGYVVRVDTVKVKNTEVSTLSYLLYLLKADTLKPRVAEVQRPVSVLLNRVDTYKIKQLQTLRLTNNAKVVDTLKQKVREVDALRNTISVTTDSLRIKQTNASAIRNTINIARDTARLKTVEAISSIRNTINVTSDTMRPMLISAETLTNVHSRMKDPSRRIYGKVYITYTDPMLDNETEVVPSVAAYNSQADQILDGTKTAEGKFFTLYDNNLSGAFHPSDETSQVGWVSSEVSDTTGSFATPPSIRVNFAARPIIGLPIDFDASHGAVAKDFTVTFIKQDSSTVTKTFTNNTLIEVIVTTESIPDVVAIVVTVQKVSKPGYPATILDLPVVSTVLYTGYQDKSDLMSIDMLEELTYEDDIEALGGISANEVTVTIDNSDKGFYFNNQNSAVAQQLRRNRKIVPWLGTEIIPGVIEWYTLGTYWSYSWNVPVNGLTTTVVGFDTIGLLGTTSFTNHQTLANKSIGQLIEYVLEDIKLTFDFIEYDIDPELYTVIIPYAWFNADSHAAALRRISECYPMHIYCDRNGRICAKPQKLHLDYYYDTWADNTNVIDKNYSSLYTALPNIINVTVSSPVLVTNEQLVQDAVIFNIDDIPNRTLNFNKPYVSGLVVTVDCDASVAYTYTVFSWGITFTFTGVGTVRSITCTGTAVDNSNTSVVTRRDEGGIRLNGAVSRDVSSDFIQTGTLAGTIINRMFSMSAADKYDAIVTYRGDIALSINDPILLLNGIAPDNRYNIKRHQLSWNGSLSGTADLNT